MKKKIVIGVTIVVLTILFLDWLIISPDVTIISDLEIKNGDRTFLCKVEPKGEVEKLAFEYLKISISDDFDKIDDIVISSAIDWSGHRKDNFRSGIYIKEIVINNINTISEEEYTDVSDENYYAYKHNLDSHNPTEVQVVSVDYDQVTNEKGAGRVQYGDGKQRRNFVFAKSEKNPEWKVVDIYGH